MESPPHAPPSGELPRSWQNPWFDLAGFLVGLGVAWWQAWRTTDLVWSLWLSSLVVGYATLVWRISWPMRELTRNIVTSGDASLLSTPRAWVGVGVLGFGSLFLLAFFTVHFGGFHFVHSIFLNTFFLVRPGVEVAGDFVGWEVYAEVFRRYWIFLPAAFLAERAAFATPRSSAKATTFDPTDLVRRRMRPGKGADPMMAPYRKVIRLHLLLFFFAGMHLLGLDHFGVYAVVYAVYFFPWRLLKRRPTVEPTEHVPH